MIEKKKFNSKVTLRKYVMNAPRVRKSPAAKLTSRKTLYRSEIPTAAIANIEPTTRPLKRY
jgi:hypothetical protein